VSVEVDLLRENARLQAEVLKGLVVITWLVGVGFVAVIAILLIKLT
jgi:hypothetical protein